MWARLRIPTQRYRQSFGGGLRYWIGAGLVIAPGVATLQRPASRRLRTHHAAAQSHPTG